MYTHNACAHMYIAQTHTAHAYTDTNTGVVMKDVWDWRAFGSLDLLINLPPCRRRASHHIFHLFTDRSSSRVSR